jgi:hypothetical protein
VANKFTYDTANKRFILNSGVTTLDAKTEFYSWVKYDWLTDPDLNKFKFPISSIGGQDIGGGNTIAPYYSLLYGWRLQFAAADQTVAITGNIITAEGETPIVENPGAYHHQATLVISANALGYDSGGSGLTAAQIWQYAVDGSLTAQEAVRLFGAALAGKVSGAEGTTIIFRDVADTKDRITATVDEFGNRSAVSLDAS